MKLQLPRFCLNPLNFEAFVQAFMEFPFSLLAKNHPLLLFGLLFLVTLQIVNLSFGHHFIHVYSSPASYFSFIF